MDQRNLINTRINNKTLERDGEHEFTMKALRNNVVMDIAY